jgi:hypothetical protein
MPLSSHVTLSVPTDRQTPGKTPAKIGRFGFNEELPVAGCVDRSVMKTRSLDDISPGRIRSRECLRRKNPFICSSLQTCWNLSVTTISQIGRRACSETKVRRKDEHVPGGHPIRFGSAAIVDRL